MTLTPLNRSLADGCRLLVSRRLYLAMFLVPLVCAFFFVDLMREGLPLRTPVGVVDLDHSQLSRTITRNLNSSELLDVDSRSDDYHAALRRVRSGEIFGFFLIPDDFERNTIAGRTPTLTFYSNMTYFVPGTLTFKGFKTVAVSTTAGVAVTKLTSAGLPAEDAMELLRPMTFDTHPLGNPWTNYSIYLSNSFVPGVLALMILLMTVWTLCEPIKQGLAPRWIAGAGGSITVAVAGRLLPQAVIWTVIGTAIQALFYSVLHFPLNNHAMHMILAMALLVAGCQSFALIVVEALPNLRLALSVCSLIGILSFSVTGFSYPVQSMYGAVGIFSYILPLRYYFLIYVDQALNGIPIYYSRIYYIALLIFPLAALPGLPRLRRRLQRPVYVP